MLVDRDIVMFADDWGRHASTPQHLAIALLRHNRILWVNSTGTRRPQLTMHDVRRIMDKVKHRGQSSGASLGHPGLTTMHPMVMPLYDQPLCRRINDRLLLRQCLRSLRSLGVQSPVIITSNPLMAGLLGKLGESSSHYLCLDDYPLLPNVYKCLGPMEQEILEKTTAVYSVSEFLQTSRRPKTGESYFLPQGVDVNHFVFRPDSCPAELQMLRKPVVGFHGLLSDWVDVGLIADAARAYPMASFVIVGRSITDLTPLSSLQNVHVLGQVPYQELPSVASCFDVGLIPFRINELTLACNPLKLLEYLSMGLPVVSTDMPEVRRFVPHVAISRDNDEFIALVGAALEHCSDAGARHERRAAAERFSWTSIADRLADTIEKLDPVCRSRVEKARI